MRHQLVLDSWQEDVLATKGNMVLRSGRQVGKSTIIGLKAAKYALQNQNKLILVISKTERQAGLLFTKILLNIQEIDKKSIKKGKDRPTKTRIRLKSGSEILCLPAGDTGYGIMGFTIDLLIADEAAFIPEEVWNSIVPALAITRGCIWLLSTPFVKKGYYYECFNDPTFTNFHTSSEDCPRRDDAFLAHKKSILTKAQYAQMYLGEFRDEVRQFFSDKLIVRICTGKRQPITRERNYFLGVDIARMGGDESTFEILNATTTPFIQIENIITTKTKLTETEDKIIEIGRHDNYGRESIGIDDAGMGAGVFDSLMRNDLVKRKIVGLNNARREIDREGNKEKLMKEVMYVNLKLLMEKGDIILLDDDEIKASLKSVQFEYNERGKMIIGGDYTHVAEGLVRAAWLANSKNLNIWIDSIKV